VGSSRYRGRCGRAITNAYCDTNRDSDANGDSDAQCYTNSHSNGYG